MNIDKKALKGVVDEIEASRSRQRGETEFQREALKRAVKIHQLDAKAVRIVLQRRAMGETKRDEQDYYVHAYELALGGKKDALEALESGATVREAALAGGISTGAAGNLAKLVQKSEIVDATNGEITHPSSGGEGEELCVPLGRVSGSDEQEALVARSEWSLPGAIAELQAIKESLGAVGSPEGDRVAMSQNAASNDAEKRDIDLTIPSRLDRRPESRRAGT